MLQAGPGAIVAVAYVDPVVTTVAGGVVAATASALAVLLLAA